MDNNFKTVTLPLGALLLTAILALGALIGYSHSLLRAEITQVRADITQVRADITELRADVQADITELRADVRADISALRSEVTAMRGELAGVRERVARLEVLVEANGKARPQTQAAR